ncbi:hypothetical protein AB0O47_19970 [Streptomyces noursei]|uniref:hypothetical protein n=1 Tax=Streptomyces noursei TaxID=1971 RepID=UPI00344C074A
MNQRTDKEALARVREAIGSVAAHVQGGQRRFQLVRPLSESLMTGASRIPQHLVDRLPDDDPWAMRETRQYTADAAAYGWWQRSKVAYAMDDVLLGSLSESSTDEVPTAVIRDVPHPNPFILLPSPDFDDEETQYYRHHIGLPVGAFVYGKRKGGNLLCSTADERLDCLGVMFAGEIVEGGRSVFQVLRSSIHLDQEKTSVEQAVARTVEGFRWPPDVGESDPRRLENWLRKYLTQVFNTVLYVCTAQPDIETYRPSSATKQKARKQRRPRAGDIDSLVKVGWRLGPELFAERQRYEQADRAPDGDGSARRSPRTHRRKPAWQTYHTGPGGSVPKLLWRKPHWVNAHRLDEPGSGPADVVVRPVR